MKVHILRTYGLYGLLRLSACWLRTKLFYHPARIVRFPTYIRGKRHIQWGSGFTTGVGLRMDAFVTSGIAIKIGNRVQLNDYVHIAAVESVNIGNDVLIASKVFITDHNHGCYGQNDIQSIPTVAPIHRPLSSSPVSIEDRVWIGENVSILPGVRIGEGSIVAANSTVTKNVAPNTIVAGSPARIIKCYDADTMSWISLK